MQQSIASYRELPIEEEIPVINYKKAVDELRDLFAASPDQAIGQIEPTAELLKSKRGGWGDGTVARPVYDVIGGAYPALSREQKDRAALAAVSVMDHTDNIHVQWHVTPYIRNPQFVVDVALMRPYYYPDSGETKGIAQNYPRFHMVRSELIDDAGKFIPEKVDSDFVVGYGLLRSDFLDCGEEFARVADPPFLNGLMKRIFAWRYGRSPGQEELSSESIEKKTKRLKHLLPKSVLDRIEPLRVEADWIDADRYKEYW